MWAEILEGIGNFFSFILTMIGFGGSGETRNPNTLRVFIKTQTGATVPCDLDPTSSVRGVKELIAPHLNLRPEEIKIIFAGKELPDNLMLHACDVGQQSFLHAVRVHIKTTTEEQRKESLADVKNSDQSTSSSTLKANHFEEPVIPEAAKLDAELTDPTTEQQRSETPDQSQGHESTSDGGPFPLHLTAVNNERSRSDFYVYCNTCEGLKEGKLRVRCAVCQSGAFTVLRDPEGWDDVLKFNQVPGSCENPDCTSMFSQFYFKCGTHVTTGEDDSSPPLPQIKRNPESVPCLACGDAKEPVLVFQCPDTHVTCIDCFQQYTFVKMDQRQFVQDPVVGYTLGCPALCPNSFVQDAHHFKLMGKYQYDRYQRFAAEECVLQAGGVLCPQPNCGMGIIPMDTDCNKIACVHGCEFVFCRLCLEGWHTGPCAKDSTEAAAASSEASGSYPIATERAALAQWDDATRRALRLTTKPCPKCRVKTERAGGCMHMECTKCSFQWCWVCQVEWSRDCMGNHWFG